MSSLTPGVRDNLLQGGGITGASNEGPYFRLVKINNTTEVFFFGYISNLEEAAVDIRYAYPRSFTKENIYTISGSDKSNPADLLDKPLINQKHYPIMKEFMFKSISNWRGMLES